MDQPVSPHRLDNKDRARLSEEFKSLYLAANEKMQSGKITQEELFYFICTEEKVYRYCKKILAFGLRFLSRTKKQMLQVNLSLINL